MNNALNLRVLRFFKSEMKEINTNCLKNAYKCICINDILKRSKEFYEL